MSLSLLKRPNVSKIATLLAGRGCDHISTDSGVGFGGGSELSPSGRFWTLNKVSYVAMGNVDVTEDPFLRDAFIL